MNPQSRVTLDGDEARRDRPAGETSGSPQRPPQRLTGAALTFDVLAEVAASIMRPPGSGVTATPRRW